MAQAGLFAEELWNVDGDEQRRKRRKTAAAMTSVVALVTHHLLEEEMMLRRRILYLHEAGLLRNPPPPRRILRFRLMPRIDEDLPESFMEETFRFTYTELRSVAGAIGWPFDGYVCNMDRSRLTGKEAMCMLLYVLATPKRVVDCSHMWGLSQQTCSRWLSWLSDALGRRLLPFCRPRWRFLRPRLGLYAAAVHRRTEGVLHATVGFIDGHNPPVARPSRTDLQQEFYSGKRKLHCVSVQGICFPDGLVFVSPPIPGRHNDLNLYDRSGIDAELKENLRYDAQIHGPAAGGVELRPGQTHFNLFGDPIYQARLSMWLWAQFRPYRNVQLQPYERRFNGWTRGARSDIEHAFAQVGLVFHGHRHKCWMRTLSSSRFLQTYAVTFALFNLRTMLRGRNQLALDNDMRPPTIAEYLT